jgi:excisionase family DNA binding protein
MRTRANYESKVLTFRGSPHAVRVKITEAGGALMPPSAPIDPSQILTIDEVAARLKVTRRVVYGLIRVRSQNPIPHFRVGQALRFNWPSVSAWLQGQKAA